MWLGLYHSPPASSSCNLSHRDFVLPKVHTGACRALGLGRCVWERPWSNSASQCPSPACTHGAGIALVPFSPGHQGNIPVTLRCGAAWRQTAGLGARGKVSVRAGPMFEGLLVLDMGFAQVTAVWVGDIRTSALWWEAGRGPDALWCCTTPCCWGLQTSVGAASLVRH